MRSVVYEALSIDDLLFDMGINAERIFPAHALDSGLGPPVDGKFIVLRWEEIQRPNQGRGPRLLTVWCHHSRRDSTDYEEIDEALKQVSIVLASLVPENLTDVRWMGNSADFTDEIMNTITRNSSYELLGKENWSGN